MTKNILPRDFYESQTTKAVAKKLIGKHLVVRRYGKVSYHRIIETEAYLGLKDPSCHSYNNRRTARTEVMFGEGGFSYVYFIYGMYFCLNVVTRSKGIPEAVLIRALESDDPMRPKKYSGPGKLCRELKITKKHDGLDMTKDKRVWIEEIEKVKPGSVIASTRVGIDSYGDCKDWLLRYCLAGHPAITKKP